MTQTDLNDPFMAIGGRKPGNVYKMHKSILGGFGTFLNPFHFTVSLPPQKMKKPKLSVLVVTSDAQGKPALPINLSMDSNVKAIGMESINKVSYILLKFQFNIAPEDALKTTLCVYRGKLNGGIYKKIANARVNLFRSHHSKNRKEGKK